MRTLESCQRKYLELLVLAGPCFERSFTLSCCKGFRDERDLIVVLAIRMAGGTKPAHA